MWARVVVNLWNWDWLADLISEGLRGETAFEVVESVQLSSEFFIRLYWKNAYKWIHLSENRLSLVFILILCYHGNQYHTLCQRLQTTHADKNYEIIGTYKKIEKQKII